MPNATTVRKVEVTPPPKALIATFDGEKWDVQFHVAPGELMTPMDLRQIQRLMRFVYRGYAVKDRLQRAGIME